MTPPTADTRQQRRRDAIAGHSPSSSSSSLLLVLLSLLLSLARIEAFLLPPTPSRISTSTLTMLNTRPSHDSQAPIFTRRRVSSIPSSSSSFFPFPSSSPSSSSFPLAAVKKGQDTTPTTNKNKNTKTKVSSSSSTTTEFDGSIFHPEHPYRDAFVKTGYSVGTALIFGLFVWYFKGAESSLEYYSGYLVEQSLSVDNLFVFVVLFEYFKVPTDYQGRVLSWGIFGAMAMRALMVFAGVEAIENFRVVLLGFAAVLVATSVKLLVEDDDGDEDEDLAENAIVKFARSMITTVDDYDGAKFFTEVEGVGRVATPLLLVLICVELSDVVFAVDSVPAVFGVTKDPFIVYTSNIFAILGLRSLYTVLANAVTDLPYLKPAVALILGLVGIKLGAEYFGYEVPNSLSLLVITSLLGTGVGASLYYKPTVDK